MEATLEKSQFSKAVKQRDYPLLIQNIDFEYYKSPRRKIHHVFHRASPELESLIINFAHKKRCGVLIHCSNRFKLKQALNTLLDKGYLEIFLNHYHSEENGRARIYQRTTLFENIFKFRLPKRIHVTKPALSSLYDKYILEATSPLPLYRAILASKSGTRLKKYKDLIDSVTLSLANGHQVFEKIYLVKHQARWFQKGIHGYQSLPSKERKHLLINGEPTIELDYKNLHPNLLLNMAGSPCDNSLYENVLRDMGLRVCKARRKALKLIVLVAINIGSRSAFTRYVKEKMTKSINTLGVHPSLIYKSLDKLYPMLKPHICTGKHALTLQQKDSEIMEDVLETLAGDGIVALPLHDSIIVPAQHKDLARQVMVESYEKHSGFRIEVK